MSCDVHGLASESGNKYQYHGLCAHGHCLDLGSLIKHDAGFGVYSLKLARCTWWIDLHFIP